jgi:hypothetical protein
VEENLQALFILLLLPKKTAEPRLPLRLAFHRNFLTAVDTQHKLVDENRAQKLARTFGGPRAKLPQ